MLHRVVHPGSILRRELRPHVGKDAKGEAHEGGRAEVVVGGAADPEHRDAVEDLQREVRLPGDAFDEGNVHGHVEAARGGPVAHVAPELFEVAGRVGVVAKLDLDAPLDLRGAVGGRVVPVVVHEAGGPDAARAVQDAQLEARVHVEHELLPDLAALGAVVAGQGPHHGLEAVHGGGLERFQGVVALLEVGAQPLQLLLVRLGEGLEATLVGFLEELSHLVELLPVARLHLLEPRLGLGAHLVAHDGLAAPEPFHFVAQALAVPAVPFVGGGQLPALLLEAGRQVGLHGVEVAPELGHLVGMRACEVVRARQVREGPTEGLGAFEEVGDDLRFLLGEPLGAPLASRGDRRRTVVGGMAHTMLSHCRRILTKAGDVVVQQFKVLWRQFPL